jgi:hypothetical protein
VLLAHAESPRACADPRSRPSIPTDAAAVDTVFIDGRVKKWADEIVWVDYPSSPASVRRRARTCSSDSASRRTGMRAGP